MPESPLALLEEGAGDGTFAGACLAVQDLAAGATALEVVAGRVATEPPGPPVRSDTAFDLASLTKLYTASAALRLAAAGRLDLDGDVGAVLGRPHLAGVTPRHLLDHRSGLPAWAPLFAGFDPVGQALATPLEAAPGARHRYSDLGFLVLSEVLRGASGLGPEGLIRAEVLDPLGLDATAFRGTGGGEVAALALLSTGDAAATERCPARGLMCGEVMDRNTWAMGGAAPHAGLFAPAAEVAAFAQAWWDAPARGWLPAACRDAAWAPPREPGTHGLGWDSVPTDGYTSAGRVLSPRSRGHLGFSGTSLWIDPERGLAAVLLTNRTHPSRDNPRLGPFRPRLHDAVARWWDARTP